MMVDDVILSFRVKNNHGYEVFLNNIRIADFVVLDELKKTKEPHFSEPDRLGDLLSEALFSKNPPLVDSLKAIPFSRLVLEFREGVEGLLNLPWEYIKDPQSGKTVSLERPFVRRIGMGRELEPLNTRPLKVLVVISEPVTLPPLNARRFHDVIQKETQRNVDKEVLQLELLNPPSTPNSLTRRLLQEDFDVVHFIGHGNVGTLAFEDELGADVQVKAENLYPFFRGKKVRLVILTACFSGAVTGRDLVSGTATALVKAGIPSVFAMQLPVEIETAYQLVGDLYAALLSQPFDQLVRSLRTSRFFAERPHTPAQWGVPVLYLQDKGRDLFQGVSQGQGFLKAWSSPSPSYFLPEKPELFVGRKELLVEVNGALTENRIVVLQGESGMGKTFLALELSHWHRNRGDFPGGIIWVDLQAGGSYDTILERIGQALFNKTASEETLKDFLARKPTLIIFDSFETVKQEPGLAKFLTSLPQMTRTLLTSIERAEIGRTVPVWEMEKDDGVEFFVRRAEKAGWDGTGYEHVSELCDALGYTPLHIELVAPQVASIPLLPLMKRVKKNLDAITAERPDLPPRHQKAEAALRISYDPLDAREKVFFARMSVFPGDASHRIISQVTEIPDAVDILSRLHHKGLVRFEKNRYGLHSTVRRFALERLKKDFQSREKYEEKFAQTFLGLALLGREALDTERSRDAVSMTRLELQSLLAAQEWFFEKGQWSECFEFSNSLHSLLERSGLWRARVLSFSRGLKAAQNKGKKQDIATSFSNLGMAYFDLGDLAEADRYQQESLKIFKEIDNKVGVADQFHELGLVEFRRGNLDKAERYFERSVKVRKRIIAKTRTDIANTAAALFHLGIIKYERSNFTESEKYYRKSLKIFKEANDKKGIANVLHELALVELARDNFDEAEEYSKRALKIKEKIGDRARISRSLSQLGKIEVARGNLDKAEEYTKKSLEIDEEIGNSYGIGAALHQLANISEKEGKSEEALKLYLVAASYFHEVGARRAEKIALCSIARVRKKVGHKKFQKILKEVEEQGYPSS